MELTPARSQKMIFFKDSDLRQSVGINLRQLVSYQYKLKLQPVDGAVDGVTRGADFEHVQCSAECIPQASIRAKAC